jgi:hypothetical protein
VTLALVVTLLLTQTPDAPVVSTPVQSTEPSPPAVDDRDARIQALEEQLAQMKSDVEELRSQPSWISKMAATFSGFVDLGFFWAQGDGSGVRKDLGHRFAPEYEGQLLGSWVLLGDPLSTAINSRGDVADLGDGRALREDPIHSNGQPTFLVNALALAVFAQVFEGFTVHGAVDFLPRDRPGATFGDLFEVKLAYLRYLLVLGPVAVTFFTGKFDSLLGLEYRTQESPYRVGITPSLICRYTCGRPTGLKVKGELFEKHLEVALSLTNGSHQVRHFAFSNETDFNRFKTVAGRVTVKLPVEPLIELNVNASVGPQDRQPDDDVLQWHVGFAANADFDRVFLRAELVKGRAVGKSGNVGGVDTPCALAPCLDYLGMYVQGGVRLVTWLSVYGRFDARSARHRDGDRFIYISDVARATVGVNVHPWPWMAVKAEYVFNRELGDYEFPDDVFTTSLVVEY